MVLISEMSIIMIIQTKIHKKCPDVIIGRDPKFYVTII